MRDPVLPLEVPFRHLNLAAWQTDDCRSPCGPCHRNGQILDECIERVSHVAVPVHEIQDFVKQDKDGPACGLEDPAERFSAGVRGPFQVIKGGRLATSGAPQEARG